METAGRYGISADRAANYNADEKGTGILYAAVSETVANVRANRAVGDDWNTRLEKDYKTRKKK